MAVATRIALALAVVRTAICGYRAATQSLVHDEAFSFLNFLNGSWSDVYFRYEANNHILYALLAKLSITWFGVSEFALRLPSVIAGFFLMLGVWRILEAAKRPELRWACLLAIGLNPLLLDLSVAARGYGLAVALLVWAVWATMSRRYVLAGVILGLGIAANLILVFPAAGLVGVVLIYEWRKSFRMALCAALIVLAAYAGALSHIERNMFYVGIPALRDSVYNLFWMSFLGSTHTGLIGYPIVIKFVAWILLPLAAAWIAVSSYGIQREAAIPSFTLAISGVLFLATHFWLKIPYPIDRTGLPWIVLFSIAWAIAAGHASSRALRGASLAVAAVFVIQFATQFHVSYFSIWWYDRSMKQIAAVISEDSRGRPEASASLGTAWLHQPALEFYRMNDPIPALRPVARSETPVFQGQDYVVLDDDDKARGSDGRAILFSDTWAGVTLAK